MLRWLQMSLLFFSFSLCTGESKQEWWESAQTTLNKALNVERNTNVAKNVIIFLGDGMDITTVTAGRIYKGQKQNKSGEEFVTTMESFPFVALSKTYNNDYQVPDSAGTATAYLCGVKANYGTLGVDSSVPRFDCAKQHSGKVTSVLKWSKDEGKSVGVVTTTRITHATPAAIYAHSADRDWESPFDLKQANVTQCSDIAAQLFDNIDIDVILGGGRRNILLNTTKDPKTGTIDKRQRTDGRNLIQEWKMAKKAKGKKATYVWNKGQFDAVDSASTDYLLGLFAPSHMDYELDRDKSPSGEPSLPEMTRKAIEIVRKNEKGYFLLIEGGRIDHAHHNNMGIKALEDFVAFDDAVSVAMEMTSEQDTLVIVTADHGHTMTIAGSPQRGNNILGKVKPEVSYFRPIDKKPYTTLSYVNGPGPERKDLTGVNTEDPEYQQYNIFRSSAESHGGQDVAIFARGPMAHLFHSVHEQNYIAHVMAYASCVGTNRNHCSSKTKAPVTAKNKSVAPAVTMVTLMTCVIMLFVNVNNYF